jgi:hypothetical protein
MKRRALIAWAWLFTSVAAAGCSAEVGEESPIATEETEVQETEQALPLNCVGRCVAGYRACVLQTRDYVGCAEFREDCKAVCDEATCEPGEPGCCQGQPTCW